MRIEIEIPKEFEEHFMRDKFEDTLHRLSADAHLIAGNYEQETAIMLIKALKESKTAYDVDKVIERIRNIPHGEPLNVELENEIVEIVKSGGIG